MSMKKIPDFIEKRLLEEYKEQGLCWRNDDQAFSRLTAVLIPLSIAALTLPYLRNGTPKLLAVSGGLLLMTFWILSSELHTRRLTIRFSRLHEIERILGLNSHLKYHMETNKKVWRFQILRRYMFWLYLPIAFFVTCDIKVEPTDPKVKVAHSVVQFIRAFSDPKVETALCSIDLWPLFGLWSTDAGIAKLAITVETIGVVIFTVVGYLIYKKYRDRIRPNPENKT